MVRLLSLVPRLVALLAGVALGTATALRKSRSEDRLHDFERRMEHCEKRLEEHESKLQDVPSSAKIAAAMEELLSTAISSLDKRLCDQVESIQVLKTTVAQTDELLERVLESIYALQQPSLEGEERPLAVNR